MTEQVACLLRSWHHHEEGSQRLIQFDGAGISFWLKKPNHGASLGHHRHGRSEIASRKQIVNSSLHHLTEDRGQLVVGATG